MSDIQKLYRRNAKQAMQKIRQEPSPLRCQIPYSWTKVPGDVSTFSKFHHASFLWCCTHMHRPLQAYACMPLRVQAVYTGVLHACRPQMVWSSTKAVVTNCKHSTRLMCIIHACMNREPIKRKRTDQAMSSDCCSEGTGSVSVGTSGEWPPLLLLCLINVVCELLKAVHRRLHRRPITNEIRKGHAVVQHDSDDRR